MTKKFEISLAEGTGKGRIAVRHTDDGPILYTEPITKSPKRAIGAECHGSRPVGGCRWCEPAFDAAVKELAEHGTLPPTTRSAKLARFVLRYAAEEYVGGAGLDPQVDTLLERSARWFAFHTRAPGDA